MNLAKLVGMAFVIMGVIVLTLSFISQYGLYVAVFGVVLIALGFVLYTVLGTFKEGRVKGVFIR
jgi:hypothetical protein